MAKDKGVILLDDSDESKSDSDLDNDSIAKNRAWCSRRNQRG